MNITQQKIGDVVIAKLEGQLNAATVSTADSKLRSLTVIGPAQLIMDLSDVSYMSSAGIRVLQTVLREVRRRAGDVRLAGVQPPVTRTLELVGLVPVLKVYDDVAAALLSFR
jgi:anti-sigma B factor antagonist